ncbi:hypothetical protein DCCM_4410 [Desulfocucumis palustris]|uniref:Uncharacterized protein n=1 Tax=Desulfocucumis palustris TaxID=1898651 RepID=A0A2L2XG13_9FIRM|nr:hypothetical protein DCCM_4410 [Desulfocucumis palustris]
MPRFFGYYKAKALGGIPVKRFLFLNAHMHLKMQYCIFKLRKNIKYFYMQEN